MSANTAYGIRRVSHYQGSTPGRVLAAFATKAEAEDIETTLSTCSFCSPGSAPGNYSTGQCYEVVRTSREPGYVSDDVTSEESEAITASARG